jgi:hypothetical protein
MNWQIFIAMIVAIPVILLPVAFLWYLNIGGIYDSFRAKRAARQNRQLSK